MATVWAQEVEFRFFFSNNTLLPVLVAGEKKLKTGEKIVPSRAVRGGLPAASRGSSSLPFGFMGLLLHIVVSKNKLHLFIKQTWKGYIPQYSVVFLSLHNIWNESFSPIEWHTFVWSFLAYSGDWFVGKASGLCGWSNQITGGIAIDSTPFSRDVLLHLLWKKVELYFWRTMYFHRRHSCIKCSFNIITCSLRSSSKRKDSNHFIGMCIKVKMCLYLCYNNSILNSLNYPPWLGFHEWTS